MFYSKNKGFTLVELMVVISIVALLSAVVLSSINTARSKGRDAQRKLMAKQIQNALELYKLDNNGSYPLSSGSVACTNNPQGSWMSSVDSDCWAVLGAALSPYLKTMPEDPLQSTAAATAPDNGPHTSPFYGFSYFSANGGVGWCAPGTFYILIYRAENSTFSPGVNNCTGTQYQRGNGTVTLGTSAQ
jgi:prepilin-type N-terminal cleavage/methylation domain-containing protein